MDWRGGGDGLRLLAVADFAVTPVAGDALAADVAGVDGGGARAEEGGRALQMAMAATAWLDCLGAGRESGMASGTLGVVGGHSGGGVIEAGKAALALRNRIAHVATKLPTIASTS